MNSFEKAVYSVLDVCISSDVGLVVFQAASCLRYLFRPMVTPDSHRFYVAAAAALPVIVLICLVFHLLVRGRKPTIMLALSPALLAVIPSVVAWPLLSGETRCQGAPYRRRIGLRDSRSPLGGTCPLACDELWIHGSFG